MTRCLAPDCQMGGLGCDNMTVILVCFLHNGETYDKLAEKCRSIPSNNNNNNNNSISSSNNSSNLITNYNSINNSNDHK